MLPRVFLVNQADNVVTALQPLSPGQAAVIGAAPGTLPVLEAVLDGHKIARADIRQGEDVLKYGARIGRAARDIRAGEWVHIHNIASCFDGNTQHVDAVTGSVMDTRYE